MRQTLCPVQTVFEDPTGTLRTFAQKESRTQGNTVGVGWINPDTQRDVLETDLETLVAL